MSTQQQARFLVLDAMSSPNGGQILRLRLQSGEAPPLRAIKGARLTAHDPRGSASATLKVTGFALFGGKPSDARLSRTGRLDVHVTAEPGTSTPVGLRWEVGIAD
jgi:hypothetical protein